MGRSREQGEGGMKEKQGKGRMKEKKRREKRSEGMNGGEGGGTDPMSSVTFVFSDCPERYHPSLCMSLATPSLCPHAFPLFSPSLTSSYTVDACPKDFPFFSRI